MKPFAPRFLSLLGWLLLAWGIALPVAHARENSTDKPAPILIKGSDTLTKALRELAKAFREVVPDIGVEVGGGGSGNGIAALVNGHADIASSSRLMRSREVQIAAKKHAGVAPVFQVVALDAVSVVVNPANPLNGISLQQLMEIYGKQEPTARWSDLGVQVPGCQDQKILPLSRKNNSGTYAFFRETILPKHDHFDHNLVSLDASDEIVAMVAQMPCAIGYSGMPYVTGKVKTLCISQSHGPKVPCVPPTVASTLNKTYPLSRSLYLYTLGPPSGQSARFLEWIKGPQAREILQRAGYIPVPHTDSSP
ncbi:MAG: phosphate ABC transporter substrate-binding protein [Magnetococcales bacterium]|nr:phosphate ABC transporter substrate-binding protein [Magnetococcales bacterium]